MSPDAGTVVDLKYTLIRQLGRGGMGEVWCARDLDGTDVAIKLVRAEMLATPGVGERFAREIKTVRNLKSAHVVKALTFGRDEELGPYLVMELLDGESMRQLLNRGPVQNAQQAVDFVVQACDALAEAHARGIVHRDLKPENLFLSQPPNRRTPALKVLDFGIAHVTDERRETQLTKQGNFIGSCNYSSPEQLNDPTKVTERSDLWSLGAILYELLTGRQAFPGDDFQPVAAILSRDPPALELVRPDLPPGLVRAVARCLKKEPSERPTTAVALVMMLAPFGGLESRSIEATLHVASDSAPDSLAHARTVLAGAAPAPENESRGATEQGGAETFPKLDELFDAIQNGRQADGTPRTVVFMLGAGFSIPAVPGTMGMVERIQAALPPKRQAEVELLRDSSKNLYQDAFEVLRGGGDNYAANRVVRSGVLNAYTVPVALGQSENEQRKQCADAERDLENWNLPPAVRHLGAIIAAGLSKAGGATSAERANARFSVVHLTTNFDPLLEVSIRKAGGASNALPIDDDSPLPELSSDQACTVAYLHGKWDRGDTLHVDLTTPRPLLARSLVRLLKSSTLVVVGYGGWDDVFTRTLRHAARDSDDFDVLWCFHDSDPETIQQRYGPLIAKLRRALMSHVRFYRDIDATDLFKKLRLEVAPPPRDRQPPPPKPQPGGWVPWAAGLTMLVLVGAMLGFAPRRDDTKPPADDGGVPQPRHIVKYACPDGAKPQGNVHLPEGKVDATAFCQRGTQPLVADSNLARLADGDVPIDDLRYRVSAKTAAGDLSLTLEPRAELDLTIIPTGKACKRVNELTISWKEGPQGEQRRGGTLEKKPGAACATFSFTLPPSAYGEPLTFTLQPEQCKAVATKFDRASLSVPVKCVTYKSLAECTKECLEDCRTDRCKATQTEKCVPICRGTPIEE